VPSWTVTEGGKMFEKVFIDNGVRDECIGANLAIYIWMDIPLSPQTKHSRLFLS
jgi:hypothetical protein